MLIPTRPRVWASHPCRKPAVKDLSVIETFVALFDTFLAAMWVAMGCVVAVNTLPPDLVADAEPVAPSFDVAMPAPQDTDARPSLVATAQH